jgi:hypothetical protein
MPTLLPTVHFGCYIEQPSTSQNSIWFDKALACHYIEPVVTEQWKLQHKQQHAGTTKQTTNVCLVQTFYGIAIKITASHTHELFLLGAYGE